MPKPVSVITEYVLEKLANEPANRRIPITRALAELSTGEERRDLEMVANLLEDVERNHRQLVLAFNRRNTR